MNADQVAQRLEQIPPGSCVRHYVFDDVVTPAVVRTATQPDCVLCLFIGMLTGGADPVSIDLCQECYAGGEQRCPHGQPMIRSEPIAL